MPLCDRLNFKTQPVTPAKWWQGGSHISSAGCDVAEQGRVPPLLSALWVNFGLHTMLASELLMKELIAIVLYIFEATGTRTREVVMPIALEVCITSDPCPGTDTRVGNPWCESFWQDKYCHACVDAKRGASCRRNLSPVHLTCCGWMARNESDFGCQPGQGAANLSSCSWAPHRTSTAVWR